MSCSAGVAVAAVEEAEAKEKKARMGRAYGRSMEDGFGDGRSGMGLGV